MGSCLFALADGWELLHAIVYTAFGATIAVVAGYVAIRMWSTADVERIMQLVRYESSHVARRIVAESVPPNSERRTVDLKPGTGLPESDRPTAVFRNNSETPS
jgi:hypothetical protein